MNIKLDVNCSSCLRYSGTCFYDVVTFEHSKDISFFIFSFHVRPPISMDESHGHGRKSRKSPLRLSLESLYLVNFSAKVGTVQ